MLPESLFLRSECLPALTELRLEGNTIGDLTPLASLTNLEVLDLTSADVSSLGPLARLNARITLMVTLAAESSGDLSPLAELSNLTTLVVEGASVANPRPVKPLITSEPLASDGVVTLTRFGSDDLSTMVEGDREPEHRQRFEFPPDFIASTEHSAAVLATWDDDWARRDRYTLAVRDSVNNTLLGGCELCNRV